MIRPGVRTALLTTALLQGCDRPSVTTPPAAPSRPALGSVYEVRDALGRTFVLLGPASEAPERRREAVVIGQGTALQLGGEEPLEPPLTFTVVDPRGACVSSASKSVKVGSGAGWFEAVELDGCRGDPSRERFAFAGEVNDARWLDVDESLTADGEPVPTTDFFEGNVSGKTMHWRGTFAGLDLHFERNWVAPPPAPPPTRLMRGSRILASYEAKLEGAVRAGQRWLFAFRDSRGVSLLELRADSLVPLLGDPPKPGSVAAAASVSEPPVPATSPARLDPVELSGTASVRFAAKARPRAPVACTIASITRQDEALRVELVERQGQKYLVELRIPARIELALEEGAPVALSVTRGPAKHDHVLLAAPDGSTLVEVGQAAARGKQWSVTHGPEMAANTVGSRVDHLHAVDFGLAGARVRVAPDSWAELLHDDERYLVWGAARRVERAHQRPAAPSSTAVQVQFAVLRVR